MASSRSEAQHVEERREGLALHRRGLRLAFRLGPGERR